MIDKLAILIPEIVLFATTCVVMVLGLSPARGVRNQIGLVTGVGLVIATVAAAASPLGEGARCV